MANNYSFKDATATTQTAKSTDTAGVHTPHVNVDTLPDVTVGAALPAGDNNIGNVDVVTLPALAAGTNNIGDVDVLTLPALPAGTNNIGDVDVLSVVPGTGATSLGKAEDAQHSSGDTGVAMLGVRNDTATAFSGTEGDYTPIGVTSDGRPITAPYSHPDLYLNGTGNATGTADTAVIAAQGAGIRIYVTSLFICNTSSTNTYVNIKDGATAKLVIPAPANSGAVISLPIPLKLTANTALNFASGGAVTTMYVSAVGYKSGI